MTSADHYLRSRLDSSLQSLVSVLCECTSAVADILASTPVHHVGTANQFGDAQLSVDVQSDAKIFSILEASGIVSHAASEEEPEMRMLSTKGRFMVCFDPLDGSSIVDCNWSVGSIFGVWETLESRTIVGACGREQVLAAVAVYGPRTTLVVATKDKKVFELTRIPGSGWIVTNEFERGIAEKAKIFSPANLRSAQDLPGYASMVDSWMTNRLTLRYTGGMVPDVVSILVKGSGIFCSPVSGKAPAKLRLVFECAPIAFIIEAAGGIALSGRTEEERVLDVPIQSSDDRIGIVCGSSSDVSKSVRSILQTPSRVISSGA
jgi:sedoheptulose-bisphosphatase